MRFITLTAALGTTLYIRADVILYVEGFTFSTNSPIEGHVGARLTLLAGQWSESCHCREDVLTVIERLSA